MGERLDSESALPYEAAQVPGDLRLADFVEKGIELLSDDPEGFFMMVEGGKIDWACHDNDTALMLGEVGGFDDAISKALIFRDAHPSRTLIVVTADHETGGFQYSSPVDRANGSGRLEWTTRGHTGADVGIWASGLGAELFSGTYPNTGVFDRLKVLLQAPTSP
jgi:alkaline phosphatase